MPFEITVPASAVSAPVSNARIVEHFNLAAGQTPENIAIAPDGTKYVTFAEGRQVAAISPSGAITVLATMPLRGIRQHAAINNRPRLVLGHAGLSPEAHRCQHR